jgi:outer membrane receptor protein involved in Fe transport
MSKSSAGVQYYTNANSFLSAEGDHFPAPGLETITAAGTKLPASSNYTQNNTLGYYAQQEFGWRDQLFVTGAVRVDNNSSFGNEVKWVTYPKASISWVASETQAIRNHLPSTVNSLRLRGAFGGSGQQPGYNSALRTYSPVAGPNAQSILVPNTFGNPSLKPERVLGSELGFEAGLLQDRLGLDFTFFNDISHDAILSRGVSPSTGFGASSQLVNAGEIQKYGVELALKGQILNRGSYGWDMGFNVATNSGKIKRLTGTDTTIDNGSYSHRIGYAPFSWFSYRTISATWDPVTRKAINPICDDGKGGTMNRFLTPLTNAIIAPKVYLGRGIPAFEGAWTNTIRFAGNF